VSVVATIRRPGARPLSRPEIERVLGSSPSFARDESGSWRLVSAPSGTELFLNVENDQAWTDGSTAWLEGAALGQLRALAVALDARVLGEEGEDITDAHLAAAAAPTRSAGKTAGVLAAILGIVLAPLLIVAAVLRLPWILWRITRQK